MELIEGNLAHGSAWEKTLLTYFQHHDIPDLALECGRELGEWAQARPGTLGVGELQAYFHGIFAKNPLSPTDRLFFADHLRAGAAEVLPAAAAETFAALLAKANLDSVYDAPAIGVHHALLRAVYGFSHGRMFQSVIDATAREEFYALCDAASAAIDQETDAVEGFATARRKSFCASSDRKPATRRSPPF